MDGKWRFEQKRFISQLFSVQNANFSSDFSEDYKSRPLIGPFCQMATILTNHRPRNITFPAEYSPLPFNLADLVSPQVEDLQVAEASEGGLIDGLNVVIVQLQSAQVGKTRQGVLRKFLDQVSPQVNGVQRMDRLDRFRYLEDSVSKQVEILDVGDVHKSLPVNC